MISCWKNIALLLLLTIGVGLSRGSGQHRSPFDIVSRLDSTLVQSTLAVQSIPVLKQQRAVQRNPFDLIGRKLDFPSEKQVDTTTLEELSGQAGALSIKPLSSSSRGRFDTILCFVLLLLFAILSVTQSPALRKISSAVPNTNLLSRLLREQRFGGIYLWGGLGAISLGAFLFVAIRALYPHLAGLESFSLQIIILGVAGATVLRLLVLSILRYAFPLQKEVDSYRLIVVIWIAIVGLLVFPLTVIVCFSPTQIADWIAWLGLVFIGLAYILRTFRAVLQNVRTIVSYPLHFILYFCALEIGSVAVFSKLLMS